jgi:hypothetical protein
MPGASPTGARTQARQDHRGEDAGHVHALRLRQNQLVISPATFLTALKPVSIALLSAPEAN